MAISENEVDDLIFYNEHGFTLEIRQPDGSDCVYTGRGIAQWARDQSMSNVPFQILDADGQLVYRRDDDGTVTVGNAEEFTFDMQRERMIRAQQLIDHTRNAIRLRFQALRAAQ